MSDTPESTASDNVLTAGFTPEQSAAPAASEGQVEQSVATEQPTSASWIDNLDEDNKAYVQNKGWQSEADLLKSYQNIEKLKNVDGKSLFNLSADMDDQQRAGAWDAMGRPATPQEYSITVGENDVPEVAEWFKTAAHEKGLSDKQASEIYGEFNEQMTTLATKMQEETDAKHQQGLQELSKEWGGGFEANVNLATRAAEHLGVTEDMQVAMKEAGMAPQLLKVLASAGKMMTEGQMIGANPEATKAAMGGLTPKEAEAKLAKMHSDPQFIARLQSRDENVRRQANSERTHLYEAMVKK